jgi:hypothetical protein
MRVLLPLACLAAFAACEDDFEPTDSCEAPAKLTGTYDPAAPGYFIDLYAEVNVDSEAPRLERTYKFTIKTRFPERTLFTESLTDAERDKLRCDPAVLAVHHNVLIKL